MPVRGVSNARSFIDTPGDTCPYALDENGLPIMRNIVPHTPKAKDRHVMGGRAGLSRLFDQQCGGPGGSEWQEIIPVAISSRVEGYTIGSCVMATTGQNVTSGAIVGNYAQLNSVPSSDGIGALGTSTVVATAGCPRLISGSYYLYFVAINYTGSGGSGEAKIRAVRSDTGATVWEYTISTSGQDRYVNTMCCSDYFLFVCTNAVVLMIRVDDGSLVTTETLGGWAQEAVQGGVYKTTTGDEYLFVGFNGSEIAGRTQDEDGNDVETIEAGDPAKHFRSGVMRFLIGAEYANTTGPYVGDPLTRDTYGWGQTLDPNTGLTDNADTDFNEGFHGYFRVSERSLVEGHGCLINALHVGIDGRVYVARTNQGYGPNAAYPPDGTTYPPIVGFAITFEGELLWEADTGSLLSSEIGLGGYANDIPTSASEDPAISQIAYSRLGVVVLGGRQNDAGYSAFGLDADTGAPQWTANLMDAGLSLRQGAIAVDPGDGHVMLGGDVNDAWDDAGVGEDAHLWKLNAITGAVEWDFLIDDAVSVTGLSVLPSGTMAVGFDYVS